MQSQRSVSVESIECQLSCFPRPTELKFQCLLFESVVAATSDPRSILQRFNQAGTEEEKIDILNWFLIDAGFESIPAYDGIEAAKNRDVYLTGLDTPSNYQGVILPEPAPPII